MTGHFSVLVTLPMTSGNTKDVCTNTYHFYSTLVGEPAPADWSHLLTSYNTLYSALITYLSPDMDKTNITMRAYRMQDPKPRVPVYTSTLTITGTAGSIAIPHELSICVSFQAAPASGASQKRRRGRIYFGPLAQNAIPNNMIAATPQTAFKNAFLAFCNSQNSSASLVFSIYSARTEAEGGVVILPPVQNGWVDNAPDIQRRRGQVATSRMPFVVS